MSGIYRDISPACVETTQPGTYRFESSTLFNGGPSYDYTKYEIVVEGAAAGTTTPASTTTAPSRSGETGQGSLPPGGSRALELAGSQRGSSVHGSVRVPQGDSGGRLEVGLFAARASLANAGHARQVRVGRLERSRLKAGTVAFAVPLGAKGKGALHRHRRLTLTVKITLTPPHGAAATLSRVVVVHA